jgi:hypothetical protein
MELYDNFEEDRLEHIQIAKSRGKGAPKKKRTAAGKWKDGQPTQWDVTLLLNIRLTCVGVQRAGKIRRERRSSPGRVGCIWHGVWEMFLWKLRALVDLRISVMGDNGGKWNGKIADMGHDMARRYGIESMSLGANQAGGYLAQHDRTWKEGNYSSQRYQTASSSEFSYFSLFTVAFDRSIAHMQLVPGAGQKRGIRGIAIFASLRSIKNHGFAGTQHQARSNRRMFAVPGRWQIHDLLCRAETPSVSASTMVIIIHVGYCLVLQGPVSNKILA